MQQIHFIQGQWVRGNGADFSSHNPATGEIVWQGQSANEQEVNAAVLTARAALPAWQKLSVEERFAYLGKFREEVQAAFLVLAEAISKEVGKPLWEAKIEVQSVIDKVTISLEAYQERCPERTYPHPLGQTQVRHKPHGVVAVFGAFNFPAHLPQAHSIPALLAGNCVVLKPSEQAPGVSQLIFSLWEKVQLPPGVLNMVQGGRESGRLLAMHEGLDGIFFTGNWETGMILSEHIAKHPGKILALEMGGNNPLVVSDQVQDITAAAYATIQSAYLTAGQRCSCARRLIVVASPQGEAFIRALEGMVRNLRVGPYSDQPEPFMGPVISGNAVAHLLGVQEILKTKGAVPLVEMHLLQLDTALLSPGIIDVTLVRNRVDEEVFGPLLQLVRVGNLEMAIQEANRTTFGLTAGLISDRLEEYQLFYHSVRAGIINWNTPLTGTSSKVPFGGVGKSGNYRPSGFYAADYCAYPVSSTIASQVHLSDEILPGVKLP